MNEWNITFREKLNRTVQSLVSLPLEIGFRELVCWIYSDVLRLVNFFIILTNVKIWTLLKKCLGEIAITYEKCH